ncbi:unnamed protein product [Adineta ricciae]|uniref:Serine/arginine-rich splicing factor 7 n=1 Tax=Adineta ricciae TaxID=249248 RepID=A0A814ML28_ADIRI|nr:unnamed protein product [Adineta ricciae]CAF1079497.1 unnamed protein product [Adineta ricciae]
MAELGAGVIILIVIWVITFVLLTLLTFVQSPVRFVGLAALVIAIIVTLVLTLLPRDTGSSTKSGSDTPYRYESLARILILTFLCVTFLVGVVMIFSFEAMRIIEISIAAQTMSRGQDEPITVFLGDLSRDATKEEVEKAFGHYGKLRSVWLSRSPWGYGFIDFEDQRDAADAVKALDGKMLCGSRVRVEFSHGRGRSNRGGGDSRRRRSGSRSPRSKKPYSPHDVCYECGDRGHYAYDCEIRLRRQRRMRSSSRSRSRSTRRTGNGYSSKRRDRSRSRSESSRSSHGRRRSHSRSRSGSDSPVRRKKSRSQTKSRSKSPPSKTKK